MERDGLLIGEVARRSGASRKALRLNEAAGILPTLSAHAVGVSGLQERGVGPARLRAPGGGQGRPGQLCAPASNTPATRRKGGAEMDGLKMSLCPSCIHCPEVAIEGDEVRIGEAGNLAVLKKDEWNVLVDLIQSGQLSKV